MAATGADIRVKTQLQSMLELQDRINKRVTNNWRAQGYPWYRAIWIESAELIDHYGWKWWKDQRLDIHQVKLELVDIWHFGLSHLLQHNDNYREIAADIAHNLEQPKHDAGFCELVERFALETLNTQGFAIAHFVSLLGSASMSFDELYQHYIGKNVLNFFRQDHGYKDGSYIKVWGDREDNQHLIDVLQTIDVDSHNYQSQLYNALKARYEQYQLCGSVEL